MIKKWKVWVVQTSTRRLKFFVLIGKWEILPKKIINQQFLGSNTSKVKPYNRQKPTKKINLLKLELKSSINLILLRFHIFIIYLLSLSYYLSLSLINIIISFTIIFYIIFIPYFIVFCNDRTESESCPPKPKLAVQASPPNTPAANPNQPVWQWSASLWAARRGLSALQG